MNRFCAIFLMVLSTSFAEPPSYSYRPTAVSTTYGVPEVSTTYGVPSGWESVSTGYSYEPSVATTHYTQHPVGHIPSEGAHIDYNLLEKVKQIILQHEQSSGSVVSVSRPPSSYGPPKSTYGPPSGWQPTGWVSRVTDLHFDHPVQSHPAAYYIGSESYASAHKGYQQVSKGWAPQTHTIAIATPSSTYGVPRW